MGVNTAVSEMTREQFREEFGETLRVGEPLYRFTSARVGGPAEMFLSVNTVRNHMQHVLNKLGAHSKLEATAIAVRAGILRR